MNSRRLTCLWIFLICFTPLSCLGAPSAAPDGNLRAAFAALNVNDLSTARVIAESAVSQDDNQPGMLMVLGIVELRERHYARAEDRIRTAIKISPRVPDGWRVHLATSIQAQGRYLEAESILSRLTDSTPKIIRMRAICFEAAGNPRAAAQLLQPLANRRQASPVDVVSYARLLLDTGQAQAATEILSTISERVPESFELLKVRGLACHASKTCSSRVAKGDLIRAFQFYPMDRAVILALLTIARAEGDHDRVSDLARQFKLADRETEQLEMLQMQAHLSPDDPDAYARWQLKLQAMNHPSIRRIAPDAEEQ